MHCIGSCKFRFVSGFRFYTTQRVKILGKRRIFVDPRHLGRVWPVSCSNGPNQPPIMFVARDEMLKITKRKNYVLLSLQPKQSLFGSKRCHYLSLSLYNWGREKAFIVVIMINTIWVVGPMQRIIPKTTNILMSKVKWSSYPLMKQPCREIIFSIYPFHRPNEKSFLIC